MHFHFSFLLLDIIYIIYQRNDTKSIIFIILLYCRADNVEVILEVSKNSINAQYYQVRIYMYSGSTCVTEKLNEVVV